jgi:hypothetical protein
VQQKNRLVSCQGDVDGRGVSEKGVCNVSRPGATFHDFISAGGQTDYKNEDKLKCDGSLLNPLRPATSKCYIKILVLTSERKMTVSITKISFLILLREKLLFAVRVITKSTNTFCGQNVDFIVVKADGTYRYHWV